MENFDVSIACDDTAVTADGSLRIIESMFSTVCDLAHDPAEVLARLHPLKKQVFDQVLTGNAHVQTMPGRRVDIELHVSSLRGGVAVLHYADLGRKTMDTVVGEAQGRGFEPGADPVIRQMRDKSFRLVFHAMPPLHHVLGAAFDPEHFCEALAASCAADMHQDDRDVFYIAQSAGAADIRQILAFIRDYRGKPAA